MSRILKFAVVAAASAAGLACAAPLTIYPAVAQPQAVAAHPVPSQPMDRLMDTTQHLRASIAAMAQRPPGPERDAAIAEARQALTRTQQAMRDLPPEYRTYGTASGAAGYDDSVKSLMAAADTLRDAIHAMAREPAGPRRNQAIADADHALLRTQAAMANAYDVTAYRQPTTTMGAAADRCVRLDTMYGCPAH